MCGILGVVNFNGKPVDSEAVLQARECMAHRGPDDSGIYFSGDKSAALAHRRLSIIDLSAMGHQPMSTDDGRFTILHNGEIYNYTEIIKNSKFKSQNLRSQSDTEVLLKLYQANGAECLNLLRGMFAFAVWDEKEKKLFAARDRFGIKPFYYSMDASSFVFASELKAIKNYKKSLAVSEQGLYSFLRNGSIMPPLTIYENVYSLLPGHYLTLDSEGKLEIKKYWQFSDLLPSQGGQTKFPPEAGRQNSRSYDLVAKEEINSALLDSIKAHCVSDVEVGAFLSGGIDSTAIVSLMRQIGHEKIKTISVTFPGSKLDEAKYSNIASKKYNTDHFEYRLTEDEVINDLDKIFDAMDQPTVDGVNTYFVSKAAHSFGLKVVMSGLGGDELFGGYPTFRHIPRIERLLRVSKYIPFSGTLMNFTTKIAKGKIPEKGTEFLKDPYAPNASYRLFRGLFTDDELNKLGFNFQNCHPELDEGHSSIQNSHPELSLPRTSGVEGQPFNHSPYDRSPSDLQSVSFLESTNYMANQLLRDSDAFSMAHSLELRVPFVDHMLYADVMPYLDSGYDAAFPKRMLVEAVGDLPDEIVHRPKMGFTFPFADWMKHGKLKNVVKDNLLNAKLGRFDKLNAQQLFSDFEQGKVHWSRVWALSVIDKFQ